MLAEDLDVVLRDGTTMRIRPAQPEDAAAIESLFANLSPESRYFRFFAPRPTPGIVERALAADGRSEYAIVAESHGRIIALAQ